MCACPGIFVRVREQQAAEDFVLRIVSIYVTVSELVKEHLRVEQARQYLS